MPRKPGSINERRITPEAASERAAARQALLTKATADTDGSDAATEEKDRAKRLLEGPVADDLVERP